MEFFVESAGLYIWNSVIVWKLSENFYFSSFRLWEELILHMLFYVKFKFEMGKSTTMAKEQ